MIASLYQYRSCSAISALLSVTAYSCIVITLRVMTTLASDSNIALPSLLFPSGLRIPPKPTERVLRDRVPRQLLQQSVEFLLVLPELRLLQHIGHRQPHRGAAVHHGVIAIGDEG